MPNLEVKVTAKDVKRNRVLFKSIIVILLFLLLLISITYGILYIVNTNGNFTITLDKNAYEEEKLEVSPRKDFQFTTHKLVVDNLDYIDNITEAWIPANVDTEADGPHNGNNYMAYTFYVRNSSQDVISYSRSIQILAKVKNVDDAVRVKVYLNGESIVYAKRTPDTDEPEPGTTPFVSDKIVMSELREDFHPGDVDKYTIVIWLEGNDPECINDIIGGELKMQMNLGENTKSYER
jgi:hypothetical protein